MIEVIKSGIYSIINLENGKMYIGSSKDIEKRIKDHIRNLKNNNHCNVHLQNSFNKYGIDRFVFVPLEFTKDLIEREQYYISTLPKLYNINKELTKVFNWSGRKHTEETKQKMAISAIGTRRRKLTVENVIKIREMSSCGVKCPDMAKLFNVSISTIHKIIKRKKWRFV